MGFNFLNWEPKPDLGPQGSPLGGPRPPDVHCTGPLRPNGQMPHGHAHGGCHDHGTLSSVLISGGEIGKRLARRCLILLLKTARARARCFPRAYRAHLRGHGSLSLGPTLSVVQSLPFAATSSCPPQIYPQTRRRFLPAPSGRAAVHAIAGSCEPPAQCRPPLRPADDPLGGGGN